MITRREFFKLGGLSLVVVQTLGGFKLVKGSSLTRHSPKLWINLSEDNILTVLVNKSEMGQGVYTGIAQIVADELDFPWEKVRVLPAPARKEYIDPYMGFQLTGGSTSIRHMFEIMRSAGAAMRSMLRKSASLLWRVPQEEIVAKEGYIHHPQSGKKEPYGRFVSHASKLPVPLYPPLKKPEEFIYIGKSVPRIDLEDKVSGKAAFGMDHFFEDNLYAVIERPPFGSRAISFNAEEVKRLEGITHVLKVGEGVAVCGRSPYAVLKAREKLKVKWSRGESYDDDFLEKHYLSLLKKRGLVARSEGNVAKELKRSSSVEATYLLPYLYHACMETMACTVSVSKDECVIYVPTQSQTWVLREAKRITGLPENRIKVITTYLGGGLGRKSNKEFVSEAIKLSKLTGRPVKLFYTREDDVRAGWFRPMVTASLKGSVDSGGTPTALWFKIVAPAVFEWATGKRRRGVDRAAVSGVVDTFYDIPNLRVEFVKSEVRIPVWFWRSVGHSHNAYIIETFLDRLAALGNRDPVDVRLSLLEFHPRAYRVVEEVARRSGWHRGPRDGQALGIAYHYSFGTHVAQVAEVSLEKGRVKVH
ncbi:MAG TPA: xanthine dehydrogenase family protein molybdopterin-binding subunit, partial [Aquifex aeolicus]|nr:xanthine dehydrogenase family protein molybdopterin-binding subunit [Aquifex aeolicus]